MDIAKNINKYIHGCNGSRGLGPLERYASFDYCFNYFQAFREQNKISELAAPQHIQESCLQLGFYLASWGMLRGSAFLLGKSVKVHESLIGVIASADPVLWEIDVNGYTSENIQRILDFRREIAKALNYRYGPSDILATKIMLGVFGNVPAFDTNFKNGFGVSTFGKLALEKLSIFYSANSAIIEDTRLNLYTLDFMSGQTTNRFYTRAKIVDMIFYIEGSGQ